MYFEKWSCDNTVNLISVLQCFYMVFGLQINLQKSNIFGISVSQEGVDQFALLIGCKSVKLPFTYLGLPFGACMPGLMLGKSF